MAQTLRARTMVEDLRFKLLALVAIAVLVGAIAAMTFRLAGEHAFAIDQRRSAYEARLNLAAVLTDLLDMETAERGYLLTEDQRYLRPHDEAVARLDDHMRAVVERVGEARARSLSELVHRKTSDVARTIALVRSGERDRAVASVRIEHGREVMDAIRAELDLLGEEEAAHLVRAHQSVVEWRRIAQLSSLVSLAMVGLLILGLYAGLRRDVQRIADHERLIKEQRVTLERQRDDLLSRSEALQASQLLLESRNRDLDQFASVTSHDLKAPLRGIGNLASWIEEDLGTSISPVVREHLDLLKTRVARMNGLIEGILEYSRAGRQSAPSQTVSVARLVMELRELLGCSPDAVRFEGEDLSLSTDRIQLAQVLQNLISNGLKHGSPTGAPVRVTARLVDDGVAELSVADDGPGIAKRHHRQIFEMFQVLPRADGVESTGIGLSIVEKLVVGQGGRVWVESEEGQGATFRFTWHCLLDVQQGPAKRRVA